MDGQLAQQDYMRLLNLQSIHTFTVSNHRNKLKERLRASAQSFRKERELLSAAASSCSASPSSVDSEPTNNEVSFHTRAGDSSGSDRPSLVSPTKGSLQSFEPNDNLKASERHSLEDYSPSRKKLRLNGYHMESKSSHKRSLILRRNEEGVINPQDLKDWQRRIQILVRNSCRRAIEERNFLPPELKGQVRCRDFAIIGKSTRSECSSNSTKSASDESQPDKIEYFEGDNKLDKNDDVTSSNLEEAQTRSECVIKVSENMTNDLKSNQPKVVIRNILQEPELSEILRQKLQTQSAGTVTEDVTEREAQHDVQNSNDQDIVVNGDDIFGLGHINKMYPDKSKKHYSGGKKEKVFLRNKFARYEEKGFNNGFKDRDSIEQSHEELLNLCVTEKKNLPSHQRTHHHLESRVQLGFNLEKLTVSENGKSLLTNGSLSPIDKENIHKEEKSKTKGVLKRQSIIQTRQGLKRQAKDCGTRDISSVVSNHIEGIQSNRSVSVDIEESLLFIKSVAPTQTPMLTETMSTKSDQIKIGRENEDFEFGETLHSQIEPFDSNSSCSTVKQVLETKCYRRNGKKICYPDEPAKMPEAFSVKNMIQPGIPSFTPQELRDRQLMNAVKVFTSPRHVPIMPDVLQLMTRFNNSCHAIVKNEPWHTAEIVRAINKYAQLVAGMAGQQQTLPVASKVNHKAKGGDKDLMDSTDGGVESSNGKTFQTSDDVEDPTDYVAPRQSLQRKAKDDAAIKEQQAKEKFQTRRPADPNMNLLMLAAETASMASSSSSDRSRATSSTRDDCSSDHESEIVYRCQVCREEFVNVIDLSVHRYEKHRTCTKCKSRFNHVRKRSLIQQELCVPCFKSMPKENFEESKKNFQATFEILKSAQKSFEGADARHDCILCPKKFENIAKMKKHLLSQHSDLLHTIDLNRLALLSPK